MNYFSEKYGLTGEVDPVSENGQCNLVQYIELKLRKEKCSPESEGWNAISVMYKQLQNSFVKRGLFHRNPDLTDRRIMSHDNLSHIMHFLYCTNSPIRFHIWDYLVRHFGTYDNSQGKSDQWSKYLPFNPSNIFPWGLAAESKFYWLGLVFYFPTLIITCKKPATNTSGKIITYYELQPFRGHWLAKHLWNYYKNKMTIMYGENFIDVLLKYFHRGNSIEFPILAELRNTYVYVEELREANK